MRNLYWCLLISSSLKAQVSEDFTDNNFSVNPVWSGDTSKWTIINGQLRSNSSISKDTFYISTPSTIATQTQWEWYSNLKFATSGSNYTDVYLICDSANLKSTNRTGYFVRIGNTKDEICLYKHIGGKNIKIIDGVDGQTNTSNNTVKIKVSRDANNLWKLKRDLTGTGLNYIKEGTVKDSSINSSAYFGISVKQSSTSFFQKHFYDNINVKPIIIDAEAPNIISTTVISATQLDILFTEYVDIVTSETIANYVLNDSSGNPSTAIRDSENPALVHLSFASLFTDSLLNTLSISSIEDFNDNAIAMINVQFTYHAPEMPVLKDIIINELFPDPSPQIGLPETEFIEVYNRSTKTINLNGWLLGDATGSSVITSINTYFAPKEYLIICKDADTLLYKAYGRVLGMSGFPSLNNTGDNIYIKTSNLLTIDSVNYSDSWYQSTTKKEGGWTLELIKPTTGSNCPQFTNWTSSNNTNGGTPGTINSVYTIDTYAPKLLGVTVVSGDSIQLLFSKAMDTATMSNTLIYSINNDVGHPVHASCLTTDVKNILLTFSAPLQQGIIHALTINEMKDCDENSIIANDMIEFIIPQTADANDLVINELLSNPREGGVDFVEIYNRSTKIIDLNKIRISTYDTINNVPFKKELITNESRLIHPKEYIIISKNGAAVKNQYFTTNPTGFIDVQKFPSLNSSSGTVCLSTLTTVIDYFKYDEGMQFALLNDSKGVSLERIDFDRPSSDRTNWHSASQTAGFATPAYENSQHYGAAKADGTINLSPELFSPDEDGINDVLTISYQFDNSGYVGNISIYDSKGRLIKNLVKNELLGTRGSYSWDGIDENKEKARIGIYVVYFEAFDLTGNVKHYKSPCVVAGQ